LITKLQFLEVSTFKVEAAKPGATPTESMAAAIINLFIKVSVLAVRPLALFGHEGNTVANGWQSAIKGP
jgi:hypothetical protein